MEEKKNNIGLVVIVAILTAVICLSVGFVIGKNILPKEESKTNTETEKQNENNNDDNPTVISDGMKNALMTKINRYNIDLGQNYSKDGINASNDEIVYFLFVNKKTSGETFTVNDLKETAKIYFKEDRNIEYGDIKYEGVVMFKLQSDGSYKLENGIGPGYLAMESFFIDGTYDKTKDTYTINTKNIYNQKCSSTCGVGYGSFYSDSTLSTKVYTNNTEEPMYYSSVYDKVKDQLPITSYTFEKNSSGNYVLTSVVIK